jgi:hypothetical protein
MADQPPVYAIRTREGVVPEFRCDLDYFEKYPIGARVRIKMTNPRSIPHHRLYWQALSKFIEATDAEYNVETLHERIKRGLRYTEVVTIFGRAEEHTLSIDFATMDGAEFNIFFEKAMALLAEYGGFDPLAFSEDS